MMDAIETALVTKLRSLSGLAAVGDRIWPDRDNQGQHPYRGQYPHIAYEIDDEPANDTAENDGRSVASVTITVIAHGADEVSSLADVIRAGLHYVAHEKWGNTLVYDCLCTAINKIESDHDEAQTLVHFRELEFTINYQS